MAVHLTYATPHYSQAVHMLRRSAARYGLRSQVYNPEHPAVRQAIRLHPDIMKSPRGAGYWLWKPFIIMEALRNAPDGAAVLYTDAAMTFIADPSPLLGLADRHPVTLFAITGGAQSTWTKRDCFIEMDADREEFWSLPQMWAGMQLFRAGPEAREFVARLTIAMASVERLTDAPNIHGMPNLPDFEDHRHDQSVLTILAKQFGAAVYPDPSQYGPWNAGADAPFGETVFSHRRRNRSLYPWYRDRLRGVYTGGRGFI